MKEWLAELRQNPRALYAIGGGALALLIVTLSTLWVVGIFGGGTDEGGDLIACQDQRAGSSRACPSATPRPTTTRPLKRSPTPSATTITATPSGGTGAATPVFPSPTPTMTPQPTVAPTPVPTPAPYRLVQDVSTATFARMVDIAMIPGKADEAVVITQQEARLRRVSLSGAFAPTDYGNLSDRVKADQNEEGLLSLAFSPSFSTDGRIYVYYTSQNCAPTVTRCVRLSRFPVSGNVMNTGAETLVLEVNQRLNASNHNGGRILFGRDGYLYVSIGDGGQGGDPLETGQDNTDLLGNILRINVTGQTTYVVPTDNPFVNPSDPGADEVWAYGLRNPWRFSFDRATNLLWLGDVGQNNWEEVDQVVRGGNYGWDCYEGVVVYEATGCASSGFQLPRAVYGHDDGSCAITGGYVYRGTAMPELLGRYIYGDYCSGKVWALDSGNPNMPTPVLLLDSDKHVSSFAELPNGELLVLTFENAVFRLTR